MPNASSLSVLIVDDQRSSRMLIQAGLQELGIRDIQMACDGQEAMRAMMVKPVHLVISDLNMPKLDGMGLLQAMRTHPPTRNTGFIFLTGAGDRSLKERAARYGVFYYLEKPVTTAHLKSQIEVVLGPLR